MMKTRRGREMTTKPESLTDHKGVSCGQSAASKIRVESACSRLDGMAEYILPVSVTVFPCVAERQAKHKLHCGYPQI